MNQYGAAVYCNTMNINLRLFVLIHLLLGVSHLSFSQNQNTNWEVYDTSTSNIGSNHIRDIKFDSKGTPYVAVSSVGVCTFKQGKFHVIPGTSSFHTNHINITDRDVIYLATSKHGVQVLQDGHRDSIVLPNTNFSEVTAINRWGVLLIGTYKTGLFMYHKNHLVKLWGNEGKLEDDVNDITFDLQGNALVSTRIGLFRFAVDANGLYSNNRVEQLSTLHFYECEVDSRNVIWAASFTRTHLFRYDGTWKEYENEAAPQEMRGPINQVHDQYTIHTVNIWPDDVVVIGTQFYGYAACIVDDEWQAIKTPASGPNQKGGIQVIEPGPDGRMWVGTWRCGLFVGPVTCSNPKPDQKQKADSLQRALNFDREVITKAVIECKKREVEVWIWDNKKPDGDIVSVILNDKYVVKEHLLDVRPRKFKIQLTEPTNSLILVAHNLGKIPPNTASVRVIDGDKVYNLELRSDLESSQKIELWVKPR